MIIRNATMDDMPELLVMGECAHVEAGYNAIAPFCSESMKRLAKKAIELGVTLVAEEDCLKGVLGMVVAPYPTNNEYMAAYEALFWIHPDNRGNNLGRELVTRVEDQCKDLGINSIHHSHMAVGSESAQRLYESTGNIKSEICYTKVV